MPRSRTVRRAGGTATHASRAPRSASTITRSPRAKSASPASNHCTRPPGTNRIPTTLARSSPEDAPDDDPDPVSYPLLDLPGAPLGDDLASVV
ncbi:MAG TPA: hypothetical protein VFK02_33245, partial [Kofleriaceae bacterium]|nr:hypothetical protein [Kofleriaceae bacterium]